MIDSLSPISLNFATINVLTILMNFCPVGENSGIKCSSNKKSHLYFRKTILGIKSLSYVGPYTWNSLPGVLKSAAGVSSFKHYINPF